MRQTPAAEDAATAGLRDIIVAIVTDDTAPQARAALSARIMAILRNLVIGIIRQAGYQKIGATIRKIRNNPTSALQRGPASTPRNAS